MENMDEYSLLANRIEMVYYTLNELNGYNHIGLITSSDEVYFENLDNNSMSRAINRSDLINLHPIDLVRVIVGLYNDVPCSCED